MEYTQGMVMREKYAGRLMKKTEFARSVGGVHLTAINYAMDNGMVDYIRVGRERVVLLTENTLNYEPNKSYTRSDSQVLDREDYIRKGKRIFVLQTTVGEPAKVRKTMAGLEGVRSKYLDKRKPKKKKK